VHELIGGPSRVTILAPDGKLKGTLPLPEVAAVNDLQTMNDGSLLYEVKTFLRPPSYSRYNEATGKIAETRLVQTSPLNYEDAEVVREFATSKDGTKIPLNIVRRKGAKIDSNTPLLLTGYGGYNISMTPTFLSAAFRLWLDAGGIFVDTNLRGGGEFGEAWHAQGAQIRKQNVFDDFAAAAEYLVSKKYTSHARMAAVGSSNGGLLMGAMLTQHPGLFRAVVSHVGLYDMMRFELDPNGVFNTTEYGSVENPAQRKALYDYSPYHHVVDGTNYPAIFMATGETDRRVNPMHSRKMIARLQAATESDYPVYLSIHSKVGHGVGSATSVRKNQSADMFSFLFNQLGMSMPPEK
jgi:prolyl oligopeptidase